MLCRRLIPFPVILCQDESLMQYWIYLYVFSYVKLKTLKLTSCLICHRTIPFAWNLVTAGYVEQSIPGVCHLLFCNLLKAATIIYIYIYAPFLLVSLSLCVCNPITVTLQVFISIIGLLFIGKLLEPIWGSREFLKFIFVVNFLTSVCVFVTAISLYYITTQEIYL